MIRFLSVFLFLVSSICSFSSDSYIFRLHLKDKMNTTFSIDKPEEFLSQRAIDRRSRQNIGIDSTDLPISDSYIKQLENLDYTVVAKNKWMNTVCVHANDSNSVLQLENLDFVKRVTFVWTEDTTSVKKSSSRKKIKLPKEKAPNIYGYGYDQIKGINGEYLHQQGYRGRGMEIAIIDAGYQNLKEILLLDNVNIRGTKDFVYNPIDIYQSSEHGLNVLSILASNRPNIYVGTAPDAKYWLLKSEDSRSEFPIEEDYWVAACEYADSVGVDLINTSLGYSVFNPLAESYSKDQLDGQTAFISRAAKIATQKGIFVEISAGNEGAASWRHISVPSDVDDVLTVGSVRRDSTLSYFSSVGLDNGRIKPDVVALGHDINVINGDGDVTYSSGTSFSGPVMTGIVACLWQAFPRLTNIELLDIIRRSGDRYDSPNERYGYGIPNMEKAFRLAKEINDKQAEY